MEKHALLINVETSLTDYVGLSINFWQQKAALLNKPLPTDFLEAWISAGYDATEMVFFRFPSFQVFQHQAIQLYNQANQQLQNNIQTIQLIKDFANKHQLEVAYAFDQNKNVDATIAPFLKKQHQQALIYFNDDATLGKPEANLYFKAANHLKVKPSKTIVIAGSKNGLLAAHVGYMRSVYIDKGLAISERIFKYSNYQVNDLATALEKALAIMLEKSPD